MEEDKKIKKVKYIEHFPEYMRKAFEDKKESILLDLKEKMLLYSKTERYDDIIRYVCPCLKVVLKLSAATKNEYWFFVQIFLQCLFEPATSIKPGQASIFSKHIVDLMKTKPKSKIRIAWQPVYNTIDAIYGDRTRHGYHIYLKDRMALESLVPRIVTSIKRFFAPESSMEIYSLLKGYLDHNLCKDRRHIMYLSLLLRTDPDVLPEHYEVWLKELFAFWEINGLSKIHNASMMKLINSLAMFHSEINWEPYMDFVCGQIVFWIRGIGFEEDPVSMDNLISLEDDFCKKFLANSAIFLIWTIRPESDKNAGNRGMYYLKKVLQRIKNELVPPKSKEESGANAKSIVYSLLYSMCNRLKREKYSKKIKPENKLPTADVHKVAELFIEVVAPTLIHISNSSSEFNIIRLIAFLYPEKVFDCFVPKLVRFFDDPNISHNGILRQLDSLVYPLLIADNCSKKFYYLNMILDYAIKEVISVASTSNKLALDLIGNLLYFFPLPHKSCMRECYNGLIKKQKPEKPVPYAAFLESLKKTNENEFHCHEFMNAIEERVCELLSRILTNMDTRERPNKENIDMYSQILLQLTENIFQNLTDELFGKLFDLFINFVTSKVHLNCFEEVNILLRCFAQREPAKTGKAVAPYALRALLKKNTGDIAEADSNSLIQAYFKKSFPDFFSKSTKYTLNQFITNEYYEYYCQLLFPLLLEGVQVTQEYNEQIEILIMLLLLENDKQKQKLSRLLLYSLLMGATYYRVSGKPLAEQPRWETVEARLGLHNIIGKFDVTLLTPKWKFASKESIVYAKYIICKYGIDLGRHILSCFAEKADAEAILAVKRWMGLISNIIPGCVRLMKKEGEVEIDFAGALLTAACGDDKAIKDFFASLRLTLLSLMESMFKIALERKILDNSAPKYSQKIVKHISSVLSLIIYYDNIPKAGPFKFMPVQKNSYKNLVDCDYVGKYSYYHSKMMTQQQKIYSLYVEGLEDLHPQIVSVINFVPEILTHALKMDALTEVQFTQVISNIKDPSQKFHLAVLENWISQAHLIIQKIATLKLREENLESLLSQYLVLIVALIESRPSLFFQSATIKDFMVEKFIFEIFSLSNTELHHIPLAILQTLEKILEAPLKYKPVKQRAVKPQPFIESEIVPASEQAALDERIKIELPAIQKEGREIESNEHKIIHDLTHYLTSVKEITKLGSGKSDSSLIVLLSFLSGHFDSDPEMLQKISNAMSKFLLNGDFITSSAAGVRLIELLALRQRITLKADYIPREEFLPTQTHLGETTAERFSNVMLNADIRAKYHVPEGTTVYVDKYPFGWATLPPYVRVYQRIEEKAKTEVPDLLREQLTDKEYLKKLFQQTVRNHEDMQEREKAMDDTGNSGYSEFAQALSNIFEPRHVIQSLLFNPLSACLSQSLFELYGPSFFPVFAELIDIQIATSKTNSAFATSLEIIVGFLRATKVHDELQVKESVEYCSRTLVKIIKISHDDLLSDILQALSYFMQNRDPNRWIAFQKELLKEFEIVFRANSSDKLKFWACIYHILNIENWRCKAFAERLLDITQCKIGSDSYKLTEYMSSTIIQILISVYDFSKFGANGVYKEEVEWKHKKPLMLSLEKAIEQVKAPLSGDSTAVERRNVKESILSLLTRAVSQERSCHEGEKWLFQMLVPICYELTLDDDKQVSNSALKCATEILMVQYRLCNFKVVEKELLLLLKSTNWRTRYVGICDVVAFYKSNWRHIHLADIPALVGLLFDTEIEVRNVASTSLSHLFVLLQDEEIQQQIESFQHIIVDAKAKGDDGGKTATHGAVLGLIAILKANDQIIPAWFPTVLTYLAKFKGISGSASDAVRVYLSEFWEYHKGIWEYEKDKFTEEQAEAVSEHINPYNYYA